MLAAYTYISSRTSNCLIEILNTIHLRKKHVCHFQEHSPL